MDLTINPDPAVILGRLLSIRPRQVVPYHYTTSSVKKSNSPLVGPAGREIYELLCELEKDSRIMLFQVHTPFHIRPRICTCVAVGVRPEDKLKLEHIACERFKALKKKQNEEVLKKLQVLELT